MKRNTPPFGTDFGPDNLPLSTNGIVRSNTVNARSGKSKDIRATGNVNVANADAATANPYKSGWDDPEHASLIGF